MKPALHPDLSVVIPTSGRRRGTLVDAAASCLASVGRYSLQVIVVHNGREELHVDCRRALEALGTRLEHVERRGANPSRNLGVSLANGRYVAFLDDDDTFLPGALARAIEACDASGALICSGASKVRRPDGRTEVLRQPERVDLLTAMLSGKLYTLINSHIFRRELMGPKMWREEPQLDCSHDFLFFCDLLKRSLRPRWHVLTEPLGTYTMNSPGSQSLAEGAAGLRAAVARLTGLVELLEVAAANQSLDRPMIHAGVGSVWREAHMALPQHPGEVLSLLARAGRVERMLFPDDFARRWSPWLVREVALWPLRRAMHSFAG